MIKFVSHQLNKRHQSYYISLMSILTQYRNTLHKQHRQQELQKFKSNIRNLIFYKSNACKFQSNECPICRQDQWIYSIDIRHINSLLISIFQQNHICSRHIELFMSKVLESLEKCPQNFDRLLCLSPSDNKERIYRKIILLLEILDNTLLLQNEQIWSSLSNSFLSMNEFTSKLMDCAFNYGQWYIQDQENSLQEWVCQIKSTCHSVISKMFEKQPFLFQNYFQHYPINQLLQRCQYRKKADFYQLLEELLNFCSSDVNQYNKMLFHLHECLRNHMQFVVGAKFNNDIYGCILKWVENYCEKSTLMDEPTIITIVQFIDTNLTFFINSQQHRISFVLSTILHKFRNLLSQLVYQPIQSYLHLIETRTNQVNKIEIEVINMGMQIEET